MNSYRLGLLLLVLLGVSAGSYQNMTQFWEHQFSISNLGYQAYAGYEEIDKYREKGTSGMFYQFYTTHGHDAKVQDERIPLLIWLQGGPGSSSQFGAFTEVGPIQIKNGTVQHAEMPWNLVGHLVLIDQPLNVGFSYSGNRTGTTGQVSSAHEAGLHLVNFMSNFYKTWPAMKKSPLYITGESYAGHYIPSFAETLLNDQAFLNETGVKLAGVCIGDGLTDTMNQINYYDSFLWSVGIVDTKFRDVLTWFQTNSILNIEQGNYEKATGYFDFITNNDTTPKVYFGGISTYNFRNYDGLDNSFAKFLQDHKADFGATVDFISGNDDIYTAFAKDISRPYTGEVIALLRKIKVLIYNGQDDFVVNTPGVLQYLNGLNWEGINQWKKAEKEIWTIGGAKKGWAKVSGNLWFVLVNKAGHMVPSDRPVEAFNMMGHFLRNQRNWEQ